MAVKAHWIWNKEQHKKLKKNHNIQRREQKGRKKTIGDDEGGTNAVRAVAELKWRRRKKCSQNKRREDNWTRKNASTVKNVGEVTVRLWWMPEQWWRGGEECRSSHNGTKGTTRRGQQNANTEENKLGFSIWVKRET